MNGKFDEKLAQLAYGELSPEEAARIEAQVAKNPEALQVLATYRSMKGGMGDLMDIPEDQLSKDRLRNAILMQGLKPQPEKASPLGWLWMPATAFLLAAGVMMFNPRGTGGDPVVAVGEKDIPTERVVINPPKSFNKIGSTTKKHAPIKNTVVATNDAPRQFTQDRRLRRRDEMAEVELVDFGTPRPEYHLWVNNDRDSKITSSVPTVEMDPPSQATESSNSIVIIEDNRDESTGAYRATEVGTASNVLIGG
ncbi:MAG: anti-sigma factor [Fimbriimonas sp.]